MTKVENIQRIKKEALNAIRKIYKNHIPIHLKTDEFQMDKRVSTLISKMENELKEIKEYKPGKGKHLYEF